MIDNLTQMLTIPAYLTVIIIIILLIIDFNVGYISMKGKRHKLILYVVVIVGSISFQSYNTCSMFFLHQNMVTNLNYVPH